MQGLSRWQLRSFSVEQTILGFDFHSFDRSDRMDFSLRNLHFHDSSQPFEIVSHGLERQFQLVSS